LGVALGAIIGSAALIGALVVGDSVRQSLREKALLRVSNAWFSLAPADRLFTSGLATNLGLGLTTNFSSGKPSRIQTATLLALPGTASRQGGAARANQIQVFGVADNSWEFFGASRPKNLLPGTVLLNQPLASQLGAREGNDVILRISRGGQLSEDSPIAPRDKQSVALSLKVAGIIVAEAGGDLNLRSSGLPPLNAFVRVEELWAMPEFKDKANVLLVGRLQGTTPQALKSLSEALQRVWTLEDAGLKLEPTSDGMGIELRSARVFLEHQTVTAATEPGITNIPILTYLANLLGAGTNGTPYSMVTAAGPPYTPPNLRGDEIMANEWLAADLGVKAGETISLSYFDPESGAKLTDRTNMFRVRSFVPMELPWADKKLMPDFPGIEKAESARDWDAGFPLVHKIRPKDEEYWKNYRGTPKAFVTLEAGQKMWANRFGSLTSMRFPALPPLTTAAHLVKIRNHLLAKMSPSEMGLQFDPIREQALQSAAQSQDFGQLFLGFSIFVVVSALLLMALLFQFALEQRVAEIGTLLALGFTGREVRRLFLREGAVLALLSGIAGALGGLAYARLMLLGLSTIWRSAVGASELRFHFTPASLLIGMGASSVIAWLTLWLTLRKQARQPPHELLAGKLGSSRLRNRSTALWLAGSTGVAGLAVIVWALLKQETANAEIFFSAAALLLVSGLAAAAVWLRVLERRSFGVHLSLVGLALRNCARRRKRSLATIALLACGSFVIAAIGVFRLDAALEGSLPASGTGGFALLGQSTLPITQDLNTKSGRDALGLSAEDLAGVQIVPMRVFQGDEASCLNLSRAQRPRLLGVTPELIRNRFTFTDVEKGSEIREGWGLLKGSNVKDSRNSIRDEIPAIGDANSIKWALGKKIGDTIDYIDEHGRPFKVRLVAAVANSILQGSLMIDETQFIKYFPGQSGYSMFLLDAPSTRVSDVSTVLSRALEDKGLELTPAVQRLDAFNAVQNTYLGTFQILGGLGLLLGSAGLGVVVLRNVLERRGELGLLLAMGFRRGWLQKLVLTEHGALLGLGLSIGMAAAAVAVLPSLLLPGRHLPYVSLALTLSAVLLNGIIWTWAATHFALRGDLLDTLRNE